MPNKAFPGKLLPVLILILFAGTACRSSGPEQFRETFDSQGSWGIGNSDDVRGMIGDGIYDLFVMDNYGFYLATAGESFSDAIYEVEATQLAGPINNGYGLIFRASGNSFYVFEVSGDGFVWIGYCSDLCNVEAVPLVGGGWFSSPAVNTGLLETNRLKVIARGSSLTFFVNGVQIGRASDNRLAQGDIAVMTETLGRGDVRVGFDNFIVTPFEG